MHTASSISEQHKQLTKALANSDRRIIQTLLPVVLADLCGKPGLSLSQALHVLQDEPLTQEVNLMLAAQYSSTPKEWNAKQLATLLHVHLSKPNSKQNQAFQLKPLYPNKT